jgi:hypothetical protein
MNDLSRDEFLLQVDLHFEELGGTHFEAILREISPILTQRMIHDISMSCFRHKRTPVHTAELLYKTCRACVTVH